MLFLASSPDGMIHILSTGVTISVYLASLCRAQKWGIRMGSCKDSEMESHKSHQPLLHSITLWGQGKELDFDCSSHLWFVVSQCIILGLSVRVYLDPFTFPRKVLQSILLIHVWFNQGGKLSLRTKSISPWCFPIIPHSDNGLKLCFISPASDSGLFSLRMWNISNIFCLGWPLAWVSAWILLVGAYEEARRCIWRKLLPSVHTTFWFCIFIPHLSGNSQGKGAKENPLMMDGYLKAIKFLFVSSETSVVFWVFLRTLRGKKSPEPIWEI